MARTASGRAQAQEVTSSYLRGRNANFREVLAYMRGVNDASAGSPLAPNLLINLASTDLADALDRLQQATRETESLCHMLRTVAGQPSEVPARPAMIPPCLENVATISIKPDRPELDGVVDSLLHRLAVLRDLVGTLAQNNARTYVPSSGAVAKRTLSGACATFPHAPAIPADLAVAANWRTLPSPLPSLASDEDDAEVSEIREKADSPTEQPRAVRTG